MVDKTDKNYYLDTILTLKTDQGTTWIVQIKKKPKEESNG